MIFRKPFFQELFFIILIIAILHYSALKLSLYYTIDWFDIIMHFLGGFWIAILTAYILHFKNSDYFNNKKILYFCLLVGSTLIVGLGWELWEIFVGLTNTLKDLNDTILDIIMDTIGAISAFYYTILKKNYDK